MRPRGLVYDVQRFSVHDGPGIRTTVFFKGCPLRCRWCQNPESLRPRPELAFSADRCVQRGECLPRCPERALTPGPRRVDHDRCTGCGDCAGACAHGALQPLGREWHADDLAREVARDAPFFAASGGGATLSGGEPTLQMTFARALVTSLRELGVSVGLQTCGAFAWQAFEPLLRDLDFVHFDLKHADAGEHQRLTGADNRLILENARRLAASGARVTFRMPVVPGLNDSPENLGATAAFLRGVGAPRLHLLRYHAMGQAKLARVGSPIPPLDPPVDPGRADAAVDAAARLLAREGVEVST
jgi:pyruvate formate lyase activating enzyme